jgi:hypothetical protein
LILLKSYLTNRHFRIKVDNEYSDLLSIHAGDPQSSVLGSLLYLFYIYDLPSSSPNTTIATFADDTAVLGIDPNAVAASQKLQTSLNTIHHWLSLWQLKANGSKSTNITFTNRRETCPTVYINKSLSHKQKMLNTLDFIWTDASLGTNISSLRGNTLVSYSQNYSDYLDTSQSLT